VCDLFHSQSPRHAPYMLSPQKPARRRVRVLKRVGKPPLFSDDIWLIIMQWLKDSPYWALMLGWTCKHLRALSVSSSHFWLDILRSDQEVYFNTHRQRGVSILRISLRMPGISCRPVPNFKFKHERYSTPWRTFDATKRWPNFPLCERSVRGLASYCRRVLMLKHGTHCALCGARWHHVPVWTLRMRVCYDCFRSHFVSNVVLFHRYGFNFWDHMTAIAGKVMYFSTQFMPKTVARQYSWDPLDFANGKGDHPFVFFWRPHLEQHLDLRSREKEHRLRLAAAAVLCQRVRFLILHANVHSNGGSLSGVLRKAKEKVEAFRQQLRFFMPVSSTSSPRATVSRLRMLDALRAGRLVWPRLVHVPAPGIKKLFDQWDDRLTETVV